MAKADRLKRLPPYLFAEIDKKKKAAVAAGRPIIDLGVGDPDKPTPRFVIEAMQAAVEDPSTHRYALDRGDPAFRNSIAAWFRERFGVTLDPETEILPTMGSKDAISHIPLAVMNPGDVCLCPDPGYPVYRAATNFAEGEVASMPLLAENDFLPDLDAIDPDTRRRATLMYINYPNNPTGATAPLEFYEKVVAFCVENSIVLVQDAAYNELYFDEPPPSI
ncbi:MAG: aminotransferase class I/II-fold pyridoxal phosphate-dependent enzyme, partial [Planctomycetia bacterium]|nr:aminotransferase class I/II-fold pyridoxal phosphate-dependent enzyme [Planctomycetia bacterium]